MSLGYRDFQQEEIHDEPPDLLKPDIQQVLTARLEAVPLLSWGQVFSTSAL